MEAIRRYPNQFTQLINEDAQGALVPEVSPNASNAEASRRSQSTRQLSCYYYIPIC